MVDNLPFEVDDVVVLLLGAPTRSPALRNKIPGITRLEKLVFLLDKETPLGELMTENPDFVPHNFGPFSAKVYQAVEALQAAGLITDSANLAPSAEDSWEADQIIGAEPTAAYTTRDFELTNRGVQYYKALKAELPPEVEGIVAKVKDRFAGLPLRQLIRYVYTRFETYTTKSVIRDQVLGH